MEDRNNVTEFILLGLSMDKKVQILCFLFFLLCYLAIWLGNLIMISITCSQLITQPMYFFVNYLALSDLFYISTVTPKLTTDLLMGKNFISYKNCMTQLFNTHFFGGGRIEVFILTAMAYDRYMAICKPLHYATIMNRQRRNSILITSCTRGLHSLRLFLPAIVLPFCGSNEIDHYFCDAYPLLKLACTDTHKIGFFVIASSGLMGLVSFVVLMASYILIFYNMHTYSAESCHKALSTCSSHISHDPLFPPVIFAYIRSVTTLLEEKVFILFYKIIVPMLNLFIYTLKNMEIGNSCTPVADSCQCMAKPIQYCNIE